MLSLQCFAEVAMSASSSSNPHVYRGGRGSGGPASIAKELLRGDKSAATARLEAFPRKSLSLTFYHSLIQECAKARSFKSIEWCVEHMGCSGVRLNVRTVNSIIAACAQVGDTQLATRWFGEMDCGRAGSPNRISYNTMIKTWVKADDLEGAERWLRRMLRDGIEPCVISYSLLIDAFAKAGDANRAEYWFGQMEEADVEPDVVIYNSVINSHARCGSAQEAKQWLLRLTAAGLKPDERSYNCLIHACAKIGAIEEAEDWVARMESMGCAPDEITYGSLLNACAKGGDVDRAEYWIEKMADNGLQPNQVCLTTVIHACAKKGDHLRADKWFKKVEAARGGPNRIAYNCIICACVKAGEFDTAEVWLGKMAEAGIFPDDVTQNSLLRAAAPGYRQAGGRNHHCAAKWTYSALAKVSYEYNDEAGFQHWLKEAAKVGVDLKRSQFGPRGQRKGAICSGSGADVQGRATTEDICLARSLAGPADLRWADEGELSVKRCTC